MVKNGVHNLGLHGVIGSRSDRLIGVDRHLCDLRCKGSEVQFKSCKTPVFASWFKLKRARKEFVWRYVISTRRADGETIRRWGRRRWRIEAFFKTLKFRFGLDQFGQRPRPLGASWGQETKSSGSVSVHHSGFASVYADVLEGTRDCGGLGFTRLGYCGSRCGR